MKTRSGEMSRRLLEAGVRHVHRSVHAAVALIEVNLSELPEERGDLRIRCHIFRSFLFIISNARLH